MRKLKIIQNFPEYGNCYLSTCQLSQYGALLGAVHLLFIVSLIVLHQTKGNRGNDQLSDPTHFQTALVSSAKKAMCFLH